MKKMKKIICIYLVLVMVLTGCGKVKHLIGGSDKLIENNDKNKNSVGIIPSDPTPSPTPTPEPSSTPTGGKDKNKDAEHSLIDTAKDFARENPEIIALFIFLAGIVWHELRQNPQPARNRQANQNQQQNQFQALRDRHAQRNQEINDINRQFFKDFDDARNGYHQKYENVMQRQRQELNDFDKKLDIGACKEFQAHQLQERQDLRKNYLNQFENICTADNAKRDAIRQKYVDICPL
jgi:hypothetical protein